MTAAQQFDPPALDTHIAQVRVRYSETDQMGIVYHANYLVWMEIGRVEFVRSRGVDYAALERTEGLLLAVVDAQCRYLSPARYDDLLEIVTQALSVNPRTVTFGYQIRRAVDGRVVATGQTRHIWLNRHLRPARLPEQYCQMLAAGSGEKASPAL